METRIPVFEDWLRWVFDHPVTDPAWHWGVDEWLEPPADVAIDYLTEVFEKPTEYLGRFPDDQANQGVNLLMSPACSSHFFAFLDAKVPIEKRLRGVRSFIPLFTQYYAARCSSHLSHIDEPGSNPLNSTCYMWWDASPFYGGREGDEDEKIIAVCIEVMRASLATGNAACQESALHGLGHFSIYDKVKPACVKVIDEFVASHSGMRPEMISYARAARSGRVL